MYNLLFFACDEKKSFEQKNKLSKMKEKGREIKDKRKRLKNVKIFKKKELRLG